MKLLQYVWKNSILKIFNIKVGTFALLIIITSWRYVQPLKLLSVALEYPVSWCVFPFVMCSLGYLILFWFGVVYINSDVPFMQHINMYHLLRTGRVRWAFGQIGGICIRSLFIVIFTIMCTILPLLFQIEIRNDWGKLLHTAAITGALADYDSYIAIYYEIFSEFTPLQIMGILSVLCTLICCFIGVLMFVVCIYTNKINAVIAGSTLAIAIFPVVNLHAAIRHKLAYFIPTVWVEVAKIMTPDHTYYWLPSLSYMFTFLIIGILVMIVLVILKVKHMEFNWDNEDV